MLKSLTTSRSLLGSVCERFIAPSWVQYMLLKLPFDRLKYGSLTLTFDDRRSRRYEGGQPGPHAELIVVRPLRTYWLLKTQGDLGFAQAYFEGAVETTSVYRLLKLAHLNVEQFDSLLNNRFGHWRHLWRHRKRHNSLANSRRNVSYHYDLGNDFYALWLDSTMTYSSGIFQGDTFSLRQAQEVKNQRILNELGVAGGEHILEVGCGWGGFMQCALERGASIKGLTLSQEQQKYALQRLKEFPRERYDVVLQDYRHENRQYDHIVSIEMFEAVGKAYWDSYFSMLKQRLKKDGKALLQIITIAEEKAESYQSGVDFIQAYIFPGGLLPSVAQIETLSEAYGFKVINRLDFGADYATTCQLWKQRFNHHGDQLEQMGYDKAFQRIWNYYLDYCTIGFESGQVSVCQFTLAHS